MSIEAIVQAFRTQSEGCASHGSPFYSGLLSRAADAIEGGGPLRALLEGWKGHAFLDALALRLLGAVHARVLIGAAPELAAFYPSVGGRPDVAAAWPVFSAVVARDAELIRPELGRGVQTNEVRRSAALLGGFLTVAIETGRPLRLLEIGSSAGLNLLWDHYAYRLGPHRWNHAEGSPCLEAGWSGGAPPLDAEVVVSSRVGCDLDPVDLDDPAARLRLESFVWPDQPERLEVLRAAIRVGRRQAPRIERASAADWLERECAPKPGFATVLFQSTVWFYLSPEERGRISGLVAAAGDRAAADAPLAWLRFEGATLHAAEVRLQSWPGGKDRLLARCDHHGRRVEWLV